jgi:hypothetical protein
MYDGTLSVPENESWDGQRRPRQKGVAVQVSGRPHFGVMASEVVFIGGRSGVGKTSVGCEIHAQLSAAGIAHCVIDGDFLDMAYPPPWEHKLAERNLAAMWENYRALRYRRLIYINTVSVLTGVMDELAGAMGDDPAVFGILLTCSDDTAQLRLGQREIGSTLEKHVRDSTGTADLLDRGAPDWVARVRTDDRPVINVAAHIIRLLGWLPDER